MRRVAVLLTVLALACLACSRGGASSDATPAAQPSETSTATVAPASEATISIADPAEADRVSAALAQLQPLPPGIEVSDQPVQGGTRYMQVGVAVTDQRRDVLEITMDDVRGILSGDIADWSQLGGSPLPIKVELPAANAAAIERAYAPGGLAAGTLREPNMSTLLADVQQHPGTFALISIEQLRPGILALLVDGHDPYRDPASASPLRVERWIAGADRATSEMIAGRLGWSSSLASFNPAGLLATGDFIPARCAWSYAEADGGSPVIFNAPGMRDLLRAADLTVVSLDAALSSTNPPTPCVETTVLQGPTAAVDALSGAGVDVITRAANHAFDCWQGCPGTQVMQETDAALQQAGIASVGSGNDLAEARAPLIIERDGVTFAILDYDDIAPWYHATPGDAGTAGLDLATLGDDVRAAKARADHVIVAMHAGIEYQASPSDRQREAAHIAAEAGASLVLGNHPHWAQAVEQIGDTFVVYALGNFVFDQPWSVETTQGMLLEVGFTKERMLGYRLRPEVIRDRYQPTLVDLAGEGAPILQRVWEASDQLGR